MACGARVMGKVEIRWSLVASSPRPPKCGSSTRRGHRRGVIWWRRNANGFPADRRASRGEVSD